MQDRGKVYPGYRWFKCNNCGELWRSEASNYESRSVEICGNCADAVPPRANHRDDRLKVTSKGRLLSPSDPIVLQPGSPTKRIL